LDEVATSLETTDLEPLGEELQALDLFKYCRISFERRSKRKAADSD
jgi:hypothetical protein